MLWTLSMLDLDGQTLNKNVLCNFSNKLKCVFLLLFFFTQMCVLSLSFN